MQAWAQYYAQGGTDPTGALYFVSVPGVKEAPSSPGVDGSPSSVQVSAQPAVHSQGYQLYDGPAGQGSIPSGATQSGSPTAAPQQAPAGSQYPPVGYTAVGPSSPVHEQAAEPPQGWPAQYSGLPNQFSALSVSTQPGQPGAPGVGAPA